VIERESATLQHVAFFEALGAMTEAHSDWQAVSAGLLVLRLVDGWLTEGSQAAQVSLQGVRAVRTAIEAIPDADLSRSILSGIVDGIEASQIPDVRPVASRLTAYGRCLDHGGHWALAVDVYRTVLSYLPPALDPEMVVDTHMRLAHCLRVTGQFDAAAASYDEAKRISISLGDTMKALHARVGEGTLAVARGNLPLAEAILDETISGTASGQFDDVRAIALHGRAFVASARNKHDAAARYAYEALRLTHSLMARDRILTDLASSLTQLGEFNAARDAFLVVATTAQEHYVRWAAMINLMEVGALQMNEPLFDRYRRELASETLPPYLRAQFYYHSALGHWTFGKLAPGAMCLAEAEALAQSQGFNQLLFEVEALRAKVRQGAAAERRLARQAAAMEDIAVAVAEMRDLVGA